MYYGISGPIEAVKLARMVCAVLGNGSNETAVQLLVETSQQETKLGAYRDPTPYSAGHGICQFDKIGFVDVRQRTRAAAARSIYKRFGVTLKQVEHRELEFSPMLSFIFCRLFYRLIPEPIPKTLAGRAAYWKKYYNTEKGAGTAEEYIHSAKHIQVKYD